MLARIDQISADIAELDAAIEAQIAPFAPAVTRLDEIPGVGLTAAYVIVAEAGLDMSRFPTAAHLCSWARFTPGVKESAGRKKGNGATGHGNRYLAAVLVLQRHLCECVAASAVMAVAGLVLSSSSPGGPVPDVLDCVGVS
jgi:transposase